MPGWASSYRDAHDTNEADEVDGAEDGDTGSFHHLAHGRSMLQLRFGQGGILVLVLGGRRGGGGGKGMREVDLVGPGDGLLGADGADGVGRGLAGAYDRLPDVPPATPLLLHKLH